MITKYLTKRGNTYYLRLPLRSSIAALLNRAEVKRSLQTANRLEASVKALVYVDKINNIQEHLLMTIKTISSYEEAQRLAHEWFNNELKAFEADIRQNGLLLVEPSDDDELHGEISARKAEENYRASYSIQRTLQQGLYSEADNQFVLQTLKKLGIKIEPDSELYYDLRFEMLNLQSVLHQIKYAYFRENDLNSAKRKASKLIEKLNVQHLAPSKSLEPSNSKALDFLINEYLEEKKREGGYSDGTIVGYSEQLALLVEILGNDATLNRQQALKVKKALQALPKNKRKNPLYRDLSIQELLKLTDIPKEDLLSVSSINKHLSTFSGFTNWAINNGYLNLHQNPFIGLKLKDKVSKKEKRSPFTPEQLRLIFSQPIWSKGEFDKDFKYWLPLLGLYTGARLDELCQLKLSDIKCEEIEGEPVWYFSITDFGDDSKRLKTASSNRVIPIHKHLIDLGLLDYVVKLKEKGKEYLLHDITVGTKKRSDPSSKWFGRFKKALGFKNTKESFHSFRHTFQDYVTNEIGEFGPVLSQILGHSVDGITHGTYGNKVGLKQTNKLIKQINYKQFLPEINNYEVFAS